MSSVEHYSPTRPPPTRPVRTRQLSASLEVLLARRRDHGCRVVFTNGCFDVLHVGHVRYLRQARSLGDLLVVGVNSDRSVRQLKGPDRPLNSAPERVELLRALSCVDEVVVFDEPTPGRLIEAIRPDVYVKGGDYTLDQLPERHLVERLGGTVSVVDLVRGRSTSALIAKIKGDLI